MWGTVPGVWCLGVPPVGLIARGQLRQPGVLDMCIGVRAEGF